ncbi:hypothetical protein C5167_048394 [Papaver somniferum]|uniref:Uncharacterized protein n=1 Tax=Papaver somniferum TaxID=3469 RepID=A0A4Y7KHU2_PAPSO|nr:hypothetical protein C5167_048394 [Papaver somniferum]
MKTSLVILIRKLVLLQQLKMVLVLMLKMGAGVDYSEMMLDALQPLYPDCGGEHTKLSAVIELLSMKASKYKRYIGSLNRKSRSKAMNYSPWLREELLGTPMTEFHRIVLGPSRQFPIAATIPNIL